MRTPAKLIHTLLVRRYQYKRPRLQLLRSCVEIRVTFTKLTLSAKVPKLAFGIAALLQENWDTFGWSHMISHTGSIV